jgi:hypothetical protein
MIARVENKVINGKREFLMKKAIFWIVLLVCVIAVWKGYYPKEALSSFFEGDTVVVEYTDDQSLLAKLKEVKTGKKVDMRPMSYEKTVDTGIACNDEVGQAAYIERKKREDEQLKIDIEAELKRIQNSN